MGVPSFLVASTVNLAIGQRLVRKLCQICHVERVLTPEEFRSLREVIPEVTSEMKFYSPKGCDECNASGYVDRFAVHEIIEVNDEVRQLIMKHANAKEIKEAAIRNGMTTMIQDALKKATQGLTSIEEILRVVHE